MPYAEILLPRKVTPESGILTYEIPLELQTKIKRGDLVKVPLRKSSANGIVWKIKAELIENKTDGLKKSLKKIEKKISEQILTKWQIELLEWLSKKPLGKDYLLLKKFIPQQILSGKIDLNLKTDLKNETGEKNQTAKKTLFITNRQKSKWNFLETKIHAATKKNQQVLILTPEIEPPPMWIENVKKIAKTEIVTGRKTEKQKALSWKRIAENESLIIVASKLGTFAPLRNIGLVIITNEQSETYLEDNRPYISSAEINEKLAELTNAEIILESTFPRTDTWEKAIKENWEIINEAAKFENTKYDIRIIDMRDEIKKGNFSPFGEETEQKIKNTLEKNEQIILFLNRRGEAGSLLCRDCGYIALCENCHIALTVHKKSLECHRCKFKKEIPLTCPCCRNPRIKTLGTGTEKIETWTKKIFPQTPLVRIDRDTIKTRKELDEVCRIFRNGLAKIAIGTSLIRPDLMPEVSLVIALLPDTTLTYPDEKSSGQTLTQLQGLKTMLKKGGEMLLQSYIPDHEIYQTFLTAQWAKFYNAEREKGAILKKITAKTGVV